MIKLRNLLCTKQKEKLDLGRLLLYEPYKNLRVKYDELISSECGRAELNKIIIYLLQKYSSLFTEDLLPKGKNKEEYLADVVQLLCALDA